MDKKKLIKLAIDSVVKVALVVCLVLGLSWSLVQAGKVKDKKETLQAIRQMQDEAKKAKLISVDQKGVIMLKAKDVIITGKGEARYNVFKGVENIGWWDYKTQFLSWRFIADKACKYHIEINYALPKSNGTKYEIIAGENRITGFVPATGSWSTWKTASPKSDLEIPAKGEYTLIIRPTRVSSAGVMNLCYVKLVPVESR